MTVGRLKSNCHADHIPTRTFLFVPIRILFAFALAISLTATSYADEQPAHKLSGRLIEVTVGIEDKLRQFPDLYDNLLAEEKLDAAKWSVQVEQDFKDAAEPYRNGRRNKFHRHYGWQSFVGNRYVSILREDYFEGYGAHAN